MGTLHEGISTFTIISRWILLRMRNVSDKRCGENQSTNFMSNNFFRKSCRLCDNVGKYGRTRHATDDNITWHTRIACWITTATDIHSAYVILFAFPRQQWLCERALILRYTHMPFFFSYPTFRLVVRILVSYSEGLGSQTGDRPPVLMSGTWIKGPGVE